MKKPCNLPPAPTKYTKQLAHLICSKIEDGLTMKQVVEKYKDSLPDESTIYAWKKKHPEFEEQLYAAYEVFLFRLIDETRGLALSSVPDGLSSADQNVWLKDRDQKIKSNQFLLTKIAPLLSKKFTAPSKSEVQTNVQVNVPTIRVVSYKDII